MLQTEALSRLAPAALPVAFVHRMTAQLGDEATAFFDALETEPPACIRLHPRKAPGSLPAPSAGPIPWAKRGHYLASRPSYTADPHHHAGGYYVQEASSMLLEAFVPTRGVHLALDLSAAPGGKATHLASLLPSGSLLIANEPVRTRASILAENLTRWGRPATIVTSNYPADFAFLHHQVDLLVVDAPCSGEGLWRKQPAAIQEWSEGAVTMCAARQNRILEEAAPLVAPGGTLIYSTCTYAREENVAPLHHLKESDDWEILELPEETVAKWGLVPVMDGEQLVGYQAYPHRLQGEGFFISGLQRLAYDRDTQRAAQAREAMWAEVSKQHRLEPLAKVPEALEALTQLPLGSVLEAVGQCLRAYPEGVQQWLPTLRSRLRVLQAGVCLGQMHYKKLVPDHALAMSPWLSPQVPRAELSLAQSLAFLKGEALPNEPKLKGHCVVSYEGSVLGWAKAAGPRLNNLYPKGLRIRRDVGELLLQA